MRLGCCLQTAILLVLRINCEWFSFVCYTMAISLSLSLSLSLTPTTLECLLRWDDLSSLFIVDVVGDVRVSACAVQLSTGGWPKGPFFIFFSVDFCIKCVLAQVALIHLGGHEIGYVVLIQSRFRVGTVLCGDFRPRTWQGDDKIS